MILLIPNLSSYRRDRGTVLLLAGRSSGDRPSRHWGELHGPATKAMAENRINTYTTTSAERGFPETSVFDRTPKHL